MDMEKIDMGNWAEYIRSLEQNLGYLPNVGNPRSFNEKILYKKRYDRDSLLTKTADKYAVRSYVAEKVGSEYLIPLYGFTERAEDIFTIGLGKPCIVKANHGSGWNYIINDPENINEEELLDRCHEWLNSNYTDIYKYEWLYKYIEPKILVEKLLQENTDYKLFMFHGECKVIRTVTGRPKKALLTHYSKEWEHLDVQYGDYEKGEPIDKPVELEGMISVASKLSEPFDFVRVDLYISGGQIYFGELTHYPGGGTVPYTPQLFDFELGNHWKLT